MAAESERPGGQRLPPGSQLSNMVIMSRTTRPTGRRIYVVGHLGWEHLVGQLCTTCRQAGILHSFHEGDHVMKTETSAFEHVACAARRTRPSGGAEVCGGCARPPTTPHPLRFEASSGQVHDPGCPPTSR